MTSKKKSQKSPKKTGVFCVQCGKKTTATDSHAIKHKKEWMKNNKDKYPVPGIRFLVFEKGEVVGRKVL